MNVAISMRKKLLGPWLTTILICVVPRASSAAAGGDGIEMIVKRLERIEQQLERMQRAPRAGRTTNGGGTAAIERRFDALLLDLRAEIRREVRGTCAAFEGSFDGRREVVVAVAGSSLRFLEVKAPRQPVVVGLAEDQAAALYRQAQERVTEALVPTVYRAVPAITRDVGSFLLQDRLVLPALRVRLGFGKEPARVSLREAEGVIEVLNQLCMGRARFALPTEEQMLVAARAVYDPRNTLLQPCSEVASLSQRQGFVDLIASRWQLTRSRCNAFGGPTVDACPPNTFVIKGGTSHSRNALECIPEYRDAVPPGVAARDTALRLVLLP